MIAKHVHDALKQVRHLQNRMVEAQMFRGWSGRARIACGISAVAAAIILRSERVPATPHAQIIGWGILLATSLVISGSALAYWFFRDPTVKSDWSKLRPVLDIAPPLLVGGVLSIALAANGQYDLLFGVWICHMGLANLTTRKILPRLNMWVGIGYLFTGLAFLILVPSFLEPLPVGVALFVGEVAGGIILHVDKRRGIAQRNGDR